MGGTTPSYPNRVGGGDPDTPSGDPDTRREAEGELRGEGDGVPSKRDTPGRNWKRDWRVLTPDGLSRHPRLGTPGDASFTDPRSITTPSTVPSRCATTLRLRDIHRLSVVVRCGVVKNTPDNGVDPTRPSVVARPVSPGDLRCVTPEW